ncbi:hypothetical protein TYRP_008140 [Tyrophagus putrescentiae]|nr:hypothetical protein TYRP_008140 [Tyrophagus putrescentiae]
METEVKTETTPAVVEEDTQPEVEKQTNGEKNGNESAPASAETKKESSRAGKETREGTRSSRRERDRNNRTRRRSRSPVGRKSEDRPNKASRSVYVANFPFDVKWTELKDLFKEKIGADAVRFVQLFENEEGKPRGCGLVELSTPEMAKKAIEVLNRHMIRGRAIVVKEDLDVERDRYGKLILRSRRDRESVRDRERGDRRSRDRDRDERDYGSRSYRSVSNSGSSYNTYGLSPQFLDSLGIKGPLNNRVFVANLDYKVNESKLEDIFRLAGKVVRVKLTKGRDGKSKGFGVVEFEHPVEAVQAISMFNNQKLFDRLLSVRLDKFDEEDAFNEDYGPKKLPSGLCSIGQGLGLGGKPLDISMSMINSGIVGGTGVAPPVMSATAPTNVVPQAASAAISALTNLAGNLQSLPTLAHSLAQFSNMPAHSGPHGNSSIPPAGYSTSATEHHPQAAVPPVYGGHYQTVPQGSNMVSSQQPQHYSTSSMAPSAGYGHPQAANISHSAAYTSPAAPASAAAPAVISSYSTYDQRPEYRDEQKYRSSSTSDTIYVRNLPMSFNWQNLRDRFNEIGEVRFAEMKGHGTALVRFVSGRDAQRACDLMNGIRIENRPIDVDLYY